MESEINEWIKLKPDDWLVKECYQELTDEEKRIRFELIEKLMLKLPKRAPNDFEELRSLLQRDWRSIINSLQVNFEIKYAYESIDEAFDNWDLWIESEEELKSLHINTDTWFEKARAEFAESIKSFYSRLATDADYKKHFPNPNWGETIIIRESHNRALLLPQVNLEALDKLFVKIAEHFYEAIYHKECFVFIIKTNEICGYSKGLPCTNLLYKLDPGQPIYHVYPINNKEIVNNVKMLVQQREEGEVIQYENYMSM